MFLPSLTEEEFLIAIDPDCDCDGRPWPTYNRGTETASSSSASESSSLTVDSTSSDLPSSSSAAPASSGLGGSESTNLGSEEFAGTGGAEGEWSETDDGCGKEWNQAGDEPQTLAQAAPNDFALDEKKKKKPTKKMSLKAFKAGLVATPIKFSKFTKRISSFVAGKLQKL